MQKSLQSKKRYQRCAVIHQVYVYWVVHKNVPNSNDHGSRNET